MTQKPIEIEVCDIDDKRTVVRIVNADQGRRLLALIAYQDVVWPGWQTHKSGYVAAQGIARALQLPVVSMLIERVNVPYNSREAIGAIVTAIAHSGADYVVSSSSDWYLVNKSEPAASHN